MDKELGTRSGQRSKPNQVWSRSHRKCVVRSHGARFAMATSGERHSVHLQCESLEDAFRIDLMFQMMNMIRNWTTSRQIQWLESVKQARDRKYYYALEYSTGIPSIKINFEQFKLLDNIWNVEIFNFVLFIILLIFIEIYSLSIANT